MSDETELLTDVSRESILSNLILELEADAQAFQAAGKTLIRLAGTMDGAMQSKQPDEQIRVAQEGQTKLALAARTAPLLDEIRSVMKITPDPESISTGTVLLCSYTDRVSTITRYTVVTASINKDVGQRYRLIANTSPLIQEIRTLKKGDLYMYESPSPDDDFIVEIIEVY